MSMVPQASFFDAHILAEAVPLLPPPDLAGGILFGSLAARLRQAWTQAVGQAACLSGDRRDACPTAPASDRIWLHAETLSEVFGLDDPRFPRTGQEVLDLRLAEDNLRHALRLPAADWWPLLGRWTGGRRLVRLNLPPGARIVADVRKLTQKFRNTHFIVDAFRHGPEGGWQGHVRLAEAENVWVTTLGLWPGPDSPWLRTEDVAEALYFTTGEVGAGKVLLARGLQPGAGPGEGGNPETWLARLGAMDAAERALVCEGNARALLGA